MSPIKGVSNVIRIPRLGKIRLGDKVESRTKALIPRATDHFVVPPEVAEVYGDKPTELSIMFPTEDPDQFAQQWLRCYSMTQGLVCIGDGETCQRKVDADTGEMASHETERWEWRYDLPCDPQECTEYLSKRCRRVMNLQFLLPDVPGLGVWQIDTSSFYSITNILNMVRMLQATIERCSMIPLTLVLGRVEVSPMGQRKKTVYTMHIKKDLKLADLVRLAQLPVARVLLPEAIVEEPPDDLFSPEGFAKREMAEPEVTESEVQAPSAEATMTDEDFVARYREKGYKTAAEVYGELGVGSKKELLEQMTYEDALFLLPPSRSD